ncbi:MAG: cellulose biosynthesis cyclic di-GMP-binding regulatory protein BcsB [Succinivibrio sp.]|nr:cellulose biosynthesis cyclic di-GMP-binding regulatory protein BcsB [Succinivibrio sp.]
MKYKTLTVALCALTTFSAALAEPKEEPDALKMLFGPLETQSSASPVNPAAPVVPNEQFNQIPGQTLTDQGSSFISIEQAAGSNLPPSTPDPLALSSAELNPTPNPLEMMSNPFAEDANNFSTTLTVAQMGATDGILLSAGQNTTGIDFTLPMDKVVTHAKMTINMTVSDALSKRGSHLELTLNNQPVGSLPLSDNTGTASYELELPFEYLAAANNLSIRIDDEEFACLIDNSKIYQARILPNSSLLLEGHQLEVGNDLAIFPLPFIDPYDVTKAQINMVFPKDLRSDILQAANQLASWFGIKADYRGVNFRTYIDTLPKGHAVLFGKVGESVAGITMPDQAGVSIMPNPDNSVSRLILVTGDNATDLRDDINILTSLKIPENTTSLPVTHHIVTLRKAYDAPKWIPTDRKVYLNELLRDDQSLIQTGIWHSPLHISFRAAPDLYQLYGQPSDLYIKYFFPLEKELDEPQSWLNITMSGNFIDNLPVNKIGILETLWRLTGGDARQEEKLLPIQPYMIYGDNDLSLYFDLKLKKSAPCSLLHDYNIKSVISDESYIDLSNTDHYAELPNLAFFVGASFPFSKYADYGETINLLPANPTASELKVMLEHSARAGNATGIPLVYNTVVMGYAALNSNPTLFVDKDIFAVSSLQQHDFISTIIDDSAFKYNGKELNIKDLSPFSADGSLANSISRLLSGDFRPENIDANRYLVSNVNWRGYLSFISPWDKNNIVVLATASNDAQLSKLSTDLDNPETNRSISGDVSIITGDGIVRSFKVGDTIYTGNVSFMFHLLHFAGTHEIWLSLFSFAFLLVFGLILTSYLKKRARRRLNEE